MVSPISNVRFCGEAAAANPLERKGAFAKPETAAAPEGDKVDIKKEKKGHALRNTIIGTVLTAAALVALQKTNVLKVLDAAALKEAKWYQKAAHYVGKAGEFIAKYTYDPIAKLFSKKGAEAATEAATEAAEAIVG